MLCAIDLSDEIKGFVAKEDAQCTTGAGAWTSQRFFVFTIQSASAQGCWPSKSTLSLDWIRHSIHLIVVRMFLGKKIFHFLTRSNHSILSQDNCVCERGFQNKSHFIVS